MKCRVHRKNKDIFVAGYNFHLCYLASAEQGGEGGGGGKAFAKESEVDLTIMSTFTASLKGTQNKRNSRICRSGMGKHG